MEDKTINIVEMWHLLFSKRKVFYWVLPITFVLSSALILCVPRRYSSSIKLVPETQTTSLGTVGSLASSFGIDIGSASSDDAIHVSIYPDVVGSRDFLISLMPEVVKTKDEAYEGTIYCYFDEHYRYPWWTTATQGIKRSLSAMLHKGKSEALNGMPTSAYELSKRQQEVLDLLKENISCTVDKKTDVIVITAKAQDAYVSTAMAMYVCDHLQSFITDYRTSKAKKDLDYYAMLEDQAKEVYEQASKKYIGFVDSHSNVNRELYKIEEDNLRAEMSLRYSAYEEFMRQKMLAQTKVQERTPIYTMIESASVPQKPSAPKRVLFVLAMCVLAGFATTIWLLRKLLANLL